MATIFGDLVGWYYSKLQRFKVGVHSIALGNDENGPLIEASGTSVKVPSPLIVGSTSLTGAELGYVDGITPGTVTASKAVVVDANKDIATFRNVTLSGNLVTGATTLSEADLALVDGITAGTPLASKALTLDANSQIGAYQTKDGIGAPNGTGVTAQEFGSGAVHKTVLTLAAASVTVTDTGGAAGAQGNLKVYDFPAGVIQLLGASYNLATLAGAGGIADGAALIGSLGQAAAAVDNATLTGTEADMIASTTGTLTAGAGVLQKHGSLVATAFDGHTTAIDAYLNLAVPDADVSASDTVAVTGTITLVWANLGDY